MGYEIVLDKECPTGVVHVVNPGTTGALTETPAVAAILADGDTALVTSEKAMAETTRKHLES